MTMTTGPALLGRICGPSSALEIAELAEDLGAPSIRSAQHLCSRPAAACRPRRPAPIGATLGSQRGPRRPAPPRPALT